MLKQGPATTYDVAIHSWTRSHRGIADIPIKVSWTTVFEVESKPAVLIATTPRFWGGRNFFH